MINVAFCGNQNVLALGSVAILSLIDHVNPNTKYNIHFLYAPNCNKDDLQKLRSLSTNNVNINVIDMSKYENMLEKITTRRFGIPSLYRILLPEVFPNLKRILYLDTDLLIRNDVAILHNTQFKRNDWLIAARKNSTKKLVDITCKYMQRCDYYNSGVLLMNLDEWRKRDIQRKVLDEVSTNKYKTPDQSAINIVCEGYIETIPHSWNDYYIPYTNPNIVHFQKNAVKHLPSTNPFMKEWLNYKAQTPLKFPDSWFKTKDKQIFYVILIIVLFILLVLLLLYINRPFTTTTKPNVFGIM